MIENKINNLTPNVEREPKKVIGKLTITRHSKTEYTEVYPDITKEGEELAHKKAEKIAERNKDLDDKEERFYYSSPSPRAESTAEIIKNKHGDNEKGIRKMSPIRAMDMDNRPKANEVFQKILEENDDPYAIEKTYSKDPRFEENPELFEPRSHVNKRAMRSIEYLIRSFEKYDKEKTPHVLATGHFEFIDPVIKHVFKDDDMVFKHVEDVEIEFLSSEDQNIVLMNVKYNDQEKVVSFDRSKREIIT